MFKKFNWGLTRPFLHSWPILGFSSLRTDYALIVQVNTLIVKVLEKHFFKKYRKFAKLVTLSHILIKHFNLPSYLRGNILLKKKLSRFNKSDDKKVRFKKKRKTLKNYASKKLKKRYNFLKFESLKNSFLLIEIFYNLFENEIFEKKDIQIKNKPRTQEFLDKQKKILTVGAYTFFSSNTIKKPRSLIYYYLKGFKEKDPNFFNQIRSPYLFKMANLAFSFYSKKVKKIKKVYRFKKKKYNFLKYKIKKYKFKRYFFKRYKKKIKELTFFKTSYKPIKKIKLLEEHLKKLKWKILSSRLQRSFKRFNIYVLPVFRSLNLISGNASFYGNFIIKNLKHAKKPSVFRVIRPLLNKMKNSNILGVKIKIKGRFTRSQRSTKTKIGYGFVPYGSIPERVDYSFRTFNAKFGCASIKLFIKYAS